VTLLLTAVIGKITIYPRLNTDTKLIDIANGTTCKGTFLVVENAISISDYYQTANTRAWYESIAGPAVQPAANPPYSDGLGVSH